MTKMKLLRKTKPLQKRKKQKRLKQTVKKTTQAKISLEQTKTRQTKMVEEEILYYAWRTICNVCKIDMTDMTADDMTYHVAGVSVGGCTQFRVKCQKTNLAEFNGR